MKVEAVLAALESVVHRKGQQLPLHAPHFAGHEWAYLKECLDTGWVSSVGKFVDRFESMLVDFTGAKYAIAAVNGTAALQICLQIAGVAPGDEVLIPTLTFIATANAVSYCGALPHFVDSEERTLGLDPRKLAAYLEKSAKLQSGECFNKKTGARIRAVVPMHTFGHPVDLDGLIEVCERYHLQLVEDAAESLGSYYHGRHTGNFGVTAALSFNGNKVVTTGGGGAILTNDEALAKRAKHLTTTARVPHKWLFAHDEIGYNYRLPNLNAALGCAQLEQLPEFIRWKRNLASCYEAALKGIAGVSFFTDTEGTKSNYWLNALVMDDANLSKRDELLEASNKCGLGTRPVWNLIHKLPMYSSCPRMNLLVAEDLESRIINIPSSAVLGQDLG